MYRTYKKIWKKILIIYEIWLIKILFIIHTISNSYLISHKHISVHIRYFTAKITETFIEIYYYFQIWTEPLSV